MPKAHKLRDPMRKLDNLGKVYRDATLACLSTKKMYNDRQCSGDVYLAALKARDVAATAWYTEWRRTEGLT